MSSPTVRTRPLPLAVSSWLHRGIPFSTTFAAATARSFVKAGKSAGTTELAPVSSLKGEKIESASHAMSPPVDWKMIEEPGLLVFECNGRDRDRIDRKFKLPFGNTVSLLDAHQHYISIPH